MVQSCGKSSELSRETGRTNAVITSTLRMLALSAATLAAGPVLAEEVTIASPIAAGSLHEGPLDMVAYYIPAVDGVLEVTATFAAHDGIARPMRIVMAMHDGDVVAFAM